MARYSYTPNKMWTSATKRIYKPNKTDPHNPSNYKPIALMNCILKLWISILTSIETQTAESEGVLSNTAYGFHSHIIYTTASQHTSWCTKMQNFQNETYTQPTRTSGVPSEEWTTEYSSNSWKNMDYKTPTLQRANTYILSLTHTTWPSMATLPHTPSIEAPSKETHYP